jgi:hypothetical protein
VLQLVSIACAPPTAPATGALPKAAAKHKTHKHRAKYRAYAEQSFYGPDTDASVIALILHAQGVGLTFYQDISDPYRVMFDATQSNALGGYTATKGIKGDFLARIKRKINEATAIDA